MTAPVYGVIGLGAIGGLYGSRLLTAGREVRFLVHRDAAAIRRDGLHVTSPWGDYHQAKPLVYDDPSAMGRCDRIIVALKTTTNAVLRELLPPLCHANTTIAMFQNGLGVEADAQAVPQAQILGGLCFVCAHKRAPGVIEHLDFGQVLLAAQAGQAEAAHLQDWADDLSAGGVPVSLARDIAAARWAKLCWNIPYNGTSVVHHCDTRRLMDEPALRSEVETLMAEVAAAAAACGTPLPAGHVQEMLDRTDRMVPYLPSMLLDFEAGRPLEVEAIYSRPIAAAQAAGVAVPAMRRIEQALLRLSADAAPGAESARR